MENEIEIREYVLTLVRHWRPIVVLTVTAAVIAAAVSFIMPPTYEAAAVISTTATGIPALVTSDAVLKDVIASLNSTLPASLASPAKLRPLLAATQTANTTTVQLKVKDNDPARTAAIANAWADVVVRQAALLTQSNLTAPEQQTSEARTRRDAAAKALVESQAASQVITRQAADKRNALSIAHSNQETLRTALQDAKSLRDPLSTLDPGGLVFVGDYLALIALSQRSVVSGSQPLLLQVSATPPSGITVGEQTVYLDRLVASLQSRLAQIEGQTRKLETEILILQASLVASQAKEAGLMLDSDEAGATYTSLSASLAEAKRSAAALNNRVNVTATMPQSPTSPRRAQNVAMAAALGLMAGVFMAFRRG